MIVFSTVFHLNYVSSCKMLVFFFLFLNWMTRICSQDLSLSSTSTIEIFNTRYPLTDPFFDVYCNDVINQTKTNSTLSTFDFFPRSNTLGSVNISALLSYDAINVTSTDNGAIFLANKLDLVLDLEGMMQVYEDISGGYFYYGCIDTALESTTQVPSISVLNIYFLDGNAAKLSKKVHSDYTVTYQKHMGHFTIENPTFPLSLNVLDLYHLNFDANSVRLKNVQELCQHYDTLYIVVTGASVLSIPVNYWSGHHRLTKTVSVTVNVESFASEEPTRCENLSQEENGFTCSKLSGFSVKIAGCEEILDLYLPTAPLLTLHPEFARGPKDTSGDQTNVADSSLRKNESLIVEDVLYDNASFFRFLLLFILFLTLTCLTCIACKLGFCPCVDGTRRFRTEKRESVLAIPITTIRGDHDEIDVGSSSDVSFNYARSNNARVVLSGNGKYKKFADDGGDEMSSENSDDTEGIGCRRNIILNVKVKPTQMR